MTFPTVASSQLSLNGSTTSHTLDLPTGIQAGDLILIILGLGANPTISGTLTTEYTERSNLSFSTARAASYYKTATGSEGSTVAFTTASNAKSVIIALRITGQDSATAPAISTFANATSTAPNPSNLTPSWGAEDTLWIPWFVSDDNNTCTAFPETANNLQQAASDTNGVLVALCTRELGASSYDAGAFTITSKPWAAYTIAVRSFPGQSISRTILRLSSSSSLTDS